MLHLAKRFAGSLLPIGPARTDEEWARAHLLEGEVALWARLSPVDRRHACGVARRVERAIGHEATRPVLAAALLHDVGKLDAGLGTFGRVVATVRGRGVSPDAARELQKGSGMSRRIGLYLRHGELGADMLVLAGSDPLTVAWAAEHHRPPDRWTVPAALARALKDADDD